MWNNREKEKEMQIPPRALHMAGSPIILREETEEDTPQIVKWRSDQEVTRYFFYRGPMTEETHRAWREANLLTGKAVQFLMYESDRGSGTLSDSSAVSAVATAKSDSVPDPLSDSGMTGTSDADAELVEVPAIGLCNLQQITEESADYGYLIGEAKSRGKGYGTWATKIMCDFARESLHLKFLTAKVMKENTASLRSFEKAGFVVTDEQEAVCSDGTRVLCVHLKKVL